MRNPLTLIREEYVHRLLEITNETELPAYFKIDILSALVRSLETVASQEYEREKAIWNEANKNEEEAVTS